ncbi:MAG: hypothetical protein VX541_04355 [Candidatus Poribacteria bacterium]|nr:hypothetical protein [Candidatus Poribacteria bacterium]
MQNTLDMTGIRKKHPNRWLLLIIYSYEDGQPSSGRILAHSKYRSKIYDARTRTMARSPDLDLRIVFTGDQRKLDEVNPELDIKLAMAEGADHEEMASLLFAEDIEKARLETELKEKQISGLEKIYKEQRITNTPANWHNTYQHVAGQEQTSSQSKTSDEKVHQNQKQATDK